MDNKGSLPPVGYPFDKQPVVTDMPQTAIVRGKALATLSPQLRQLDSF